MCNCCKGQQAHRPTWVLVGDVVRGIEHPVRFLDLARVNPFLHSPPFTVMRVGGVVPSAFRAWSTSSRPWPSTSLPVASFSAKDCVKPQRVMEVRRAARSCFLGLREAHRRVARAVYTMQISALALGYGDCSSSVGACPPVERRRRTQTRASRRGRVCRCSGCSVAA